MMFGVDIIIDENDNIYLLEVNVNPGMSCAFFQELYKPFFDIAFPMILSGAPAPPTPPPAAPAPPPPDAAPDAAPPTPE